MKPYWSVERACIANTQNVGVELVMNGRVVAEKTITADGTIRELAFDVPIDQSSWVALRVLAAAHTNPIFVMVAGKPIRASIASAEWAQTAARQCWRQKAPRISPGEQAAAGVAYDKAEAIYKRLAAECTTR